MSDPRRTIAWAISKAAQVLPAAERQALRAFLRRLTGEPTKRKRHSWHRRKAKRAQPKWGRDHEAKPRAKRSTQLDLPMGPDR